MNFDLTPDQQQLQARVRDFAQAEVAPIAEKLDRDGVFPAALYRQLGDLGVTSIPVNFLNPRPGTPFGDLPLMDSHDALRTIAAFRLAMPRTVLRYAGGRELTLGDLGTRDGLLGGINAVIVGNYLTTLGRDADEDLALLSDLKMPIKELAKTL